MSGHQTELILWFRENLHDSQQSVHSYIDLCNLDASGTAFGKMIIESLLKQNAVESQIQAPPKTDALLFQIFQNAKNALAFSGHHSLGLGFPIVRLQGNKRKEDYLAPLFIWDLQLTQQDANSTSWTLSHKAQAPIRLNQALFHHMKSKYKIDLSKLSSPLLTNKSLNTISLSKICYELSSALGQKEDIFPENIQAIHQASGASILCAGVISNFNYTAPSIKSKRKKEIDQAVRLQHTFSLTTLDTWQEKAFHNIWQNKVSHIVAAPGTGKSHLLHHGLINSLSNGLTSLVVVDHMERIKKIRNELSASGLDQLMLEITNPDKDLVRVVKALSYKSSVAKEVFNEAHFKYILNRCQRQKDRLDTAFSSLKKVTFDKANWSAVVGKYLQYHRKEKQDLLDNQLQASDFTFHPTEYISIKEAIKTSIPLYQKINTLSHPLHQLHHDIFLEKTKEEASDFIEEQLTIFQKKFEQLHHRYILKQQDYSKDLYHHNERFYQDALIKIEALKDLIEDNRLRYGDDFEESGIIKTGRLKVYGVFSNKHKHILQARNLLNQQFKTLSTTLQNKLGDQLNILENIESKPISKVSSHLDELEDQLYDWSSQLPEQLQEALQRLNTKSIDTNLDYKEQINELEYTLDMDIEALNACPLYLETISHQMLTIPKRQLFIQEIINQLQVTRNLLKDFEDFYEWQRHWLLLPELHRKLLTAIIKVNPGDWQLAFQSWYFYQKLKADFHFKMPHDEALLLDFEKEVMALRALLPIQIRQHWKQKTQQKKSIPAKNNLSLSSLFTDHLDLLSQQFPIIVITASVAAKIVQSEPLAFDLSYIFNNAQAKKTLDTLPQIKGRTVLFEEDATFDQSIPSVTTFLKNVHKKTPTICFNFSNRLLKESTQNLVKPLTTKVSPFYVKKVEAQFKQGVNIKEAEAILEDLIQEARKNVTDSSKIALVCGTIQQRDYIARKLVYESSRAGTDAQKIKAFIDQRLEVFHLGEARINHFKHLYFSLSIHQFNPATEDSFNLLNNKNTYSLLHQLLQTNFSTTRIYHTLTDHDLEQYLAYKTKKAPRLLAAWIKYASTANPQKILDLFPVQIAKKDHKLCQEIANELRPFIGKNRIQLATTLHGITFPLLISPTHPKGKSIAILCDGSLDTPSMLSHLWKLELIRLLKANHIATCFAWSVSWFQNPNLEARKLASAILKMDKETA